MAEKPHTESPHHTVFWKYSPLFVELLPLHFAWTLLVIDLWWFRFGVMVNISLPTSSISSRRKGDVVNIRIRQYKEALYQGTARVKRFKKGRNPERTAAIGQGSSVVPT